MSDQQQNPLEPFMRATAAAMRAISEDPALEVSFGATLPEAGDNKLCVSLPHVGSTAKQLDVVRGMGDELALRLKHHSSVLHKLCLPVSNDAQEMFWCLEEARIASIGSLRMEGVAQNLDAYLDYQCKQALFDTITEGAQAPLGVAVGFVVRQALTGRKLPPAAENVARFWRQYIEERAGSNIHKLKQHLLHQEQFAQLCRRILNDLGMTEEYESSSGIGHSGRDGNAKYESPPDEVSIAHDSVFGEGSQGEVMPVPMDAEADASKPREEGDGYGAGGTAPGAWQPVQLAPNYCVYTTEFDETVRAEELVDTEELTRLRLLLDRLLASRRDESSRLSNRLQRRLLALQNRSWDFDLEEGVLDPSRLASVIAQPINPLVYKREREIEFRDTVVTLLIDSSGSMRGRSINIAAMCADILGRTLERCTVKVEILGFTTRSWLGGDSHKQWADHGQPSNPGRLSDLRHIIYKSADDPWRRVRKNLGLMMHDELLKENIDGEALLWAYSRLMARSEHRKILMVISDGLPIDNSTLLVNASNYLEQHLSHAIEMIEERSEVDLIAIGIGHDVSRHYQRAVTITDAEQLGDVMVGELVSLFETN